MPQEGEAGADGPHVRTVALPSTVYRVARKHAATRYSRIRPEDDADPKAGHRWDVVGGGVLYAGSTSRIAFVETLGVLRPAPGVVLPDADDDAQFMLPGSVPADWRDSRAIFELSAGHRNGLPMFVDLADLQTRTALGAVLQEFLKPMGIGHIDVPEVTSANRVATRMLARAIYSAQDEEGVNVYGGIRYVSRYDPHEICWAIFDHYPVEVVRQSPIEASDAVLKSAAKDLGLTVH
ncbi:RES family NAD+ phosphorylase [Demequina sp.]|uniref:RES family NAD+ phosphorylase n=1 Tax=Demequina sp. TaxID=2050685 RepID=UPI0025C6F4D0|nr:RES family NAD+ phosphorylase [Demequina sp.]